MADVFISYAKARRDLASALATVLERRRVSVWWDSELLDEDFTDEIAAQMKSASAIIAIWTPESIHSKWVKAEAQYGWRMKKLINIHLDSVDPEDGIPFPCNRINSIRTQETEKIVSAVLRRLQGLPANDPFIAEPARAAAPAPKSKQEPQPGQIFQDLLYSPKMVIVPAGTFLMGAPQTEAGSRSNERPVHPVRIVKPFAVGQYPVTIQNWEDARKNGFDVPSLAGIPNYPATNVTWHGANRYAEWLRHKTGRPYRLLSEAEWEYVCRADSFNAYFLDQGPRATNARFDTRFCEKKHRTSLTSLVGPLPVGSYLPNKFNVHDMHGNIWEWVEDDFHFSYAGAPSDGSSWKTEPRSQHRVLRGGCFASGPRHLRSARRARCTLEPSEPHKVGFRVACTL